MIRRFEFVEGTFVEGTSSKFYEVQIEGTSVRVRYGRIGADGQTQTTEFPDVSNVEGG